ncbi:MAG: ATP-dependent DNA helicase RecG [Candidatus Nitrotoga sp.]|nr:ATP-dependent DNA helicase RecG [Candidatus Nitrotoga sp.]
MCFSNPNVLPASISEATLTKLAKLGIHNRFDLVLHLPLRYEDETRVTQIVELAHGVSTQVEGEIIHNEVTFRPRRSLICQLQDSSGVLHLRFLNFYPSQQKQLEVGKKIRALGEVRMGYFGMEMVHPKCRVAGESTPLKQALTPVYPTTAGLPQATLSKHIQAALNELELPDTLPADLLTRLKLPSFADSVRLLHNPPSDIDEEALLKRTHHAWLRIKFDELLAQQLSMRIHYRKRQSRNAPRLRALGHFTQRLLQTLTFSLTTAQQKTLREISRDLEQAHPMQRLLQGDVGSGKTIVALLAALQAIENGYQVALMSPTEILAEQHYHKLRDWLEPLGISPVWLSGSLKKKDKQAAIERIAQGETQLAIGTHALFQDQVTFPKLGLVIVDEQHKFGVQQRLALRGKGDEPHQLMMSATPIPRTLAMSYYADLDVSVIDELPPGRTPVITKLVSDNRREEVLARVRQACLAGQQAYWVCPLIDESDTLELQTALETHQKLAQALPDLRVGLVHGKLNAAEKIRAMAAFKTGETHLLVATTVVEVGVDVPNAAMMVIEHAERMGLAQLHQLRGRVGRGAAQSLCILLFQQPLSELARARLKIIYENTDGFEIAQQDLSLRGPGELLGARQSGVPMLRFADVTEDAALLNCAQAIADEMLCDFQQEARAHLQRWMANRQDYLHV